MDCEHQVRILRAGISGEGVQDVRTPPTSVRVRVRVQDVRNPPTSQPGLSLSPRVIEIERGDTFRKMSSYKCAEMGKKRLVRCLSAGTPAQLTLRVCVLDGSARRQRGVDDVNAPALLEHRS